MHQLESFFWGILAALGALVIEVLIFSSHAFFTDPYGDFSLQKYYAIPLVILAIATIEEMLKLLIIIKRIEPISFQRSFVTNSLFVGMGFAAVELLIIKWHGYFDQSHLRNLIEITLLHMSTAGFIGYRIALHNHKRAFTMAMTIAIAATMHFLYNFFVAFQGERFPFATTALISVLVLVTIVNISTIKAKLAA